MHEKNSQYDDDQKCGYDCDYNRHYDFTMDTVGFVAKATVTVEEAQRDSALEALAVEGGGTASAHDWEPSRLSAFVAEHHLEQRFGAIIHTVLGEDDSKSSQSHTRAGNKSGSETYATKSASSS